MTSYYVAYHTSIGFMWPSTFGLAATLITGWTLSACLPTRPTDEALQSHVVGGDAAGGDRWRVVSIHADSCLPRQSTAGTTGDTPLSDKGQFHLVGITTEAIEITDKMAFWLGVLGVLSH